MPSNRIDGASTSRHSFDAPSTPPDAPGIGDDELSGSTCSEVVGGRAPQQPRAPSIATTARKLVTDAGGRSSLASVRCGWLTSRVAIAGPLLDIEHPDRCRWPTDGVRVDVPDSVVDRRVEHDRDDGSHQRRARRADERVFVECASNSSRFSSRCWCSGWAATYSTAGFAKIIG
jgi:hypothetical protein